MPLIILPPYLMAQQGIQVGDWTVAWMSKSDNHATNIFDYDIPLEDVQNATLAAIGYFDSTQPEIFITNMYSFEIPADWKVQHPFRYTRKDITLPVTREANKAVSNSMLRFGFHTFSSGSFAAGSWATGNGGRICIVGTDAPYYNSWNYSGEDNASLSNQNYDTTKASPTRRFIILVK